MSGIIDGAGSKSGIITTDTFQLDGSTAARAAQYGSEISALHTKSTFSPGRYWLTGKTSDGQTAQQVFVDSEGWMLVYRHAGTNGSADSTYRIEGDSIGDGAIGTIYHPNQGLTEEGSSTTVQSRGMSRLSKSFCHSLGGASASGNVIRMEGMPSAYYTSDNPGTVAYLTDCQIWWRASSGYDSSISYGPTYAGRRTNTSVTPDASRPIGTYRAGGDVAPVMISYFHDTGSAYSGGYDGGTWHIGMNIWIREY